MAPTLAALAALALLAGGGDAPPPADAPPSAVPAQDDTALAEDAGRIPTRRYLIERIDLRGLILTRDDAVRGHLLVAEGEILDQDRVLLSRLGLLQLGWFSRVNTRVERGSERGKVVLVFELVERNTVVVTDLVFGSTGPQPFYGGLGLSQQNFLGRGLGLSGGFVFGGTPMGREQDPYRFTVRAGFFAPDLAVGRFRLVAGLSGVALRGEELVCGDPDCDAYSGDYGRAPRLRYQRVGGEGTLGVRPGPFERLLASFRFERLHATWLGADAAAVAAGPYALPGWSQLAALTGSYEVDTRDDFFYPTDGFRALGQVTFASALLGSDYEYSKYLVQAETSYGILHVPLRLQLALGAMQGNAPFFDRFYPADFSYFAVGPALGRAMELNFSTDSRYDAFLAMGGVEYGLPLWARGGFFHRGYLALGARAVWSSARLGGGRTAFSRSPFSADAALRLDTPVGTFNVSLGYALDIAL